MFELYTLEGCPFCRDTLKILNENNLQYKNIIVEQDKKNYYKNKHDMDTFPQIFYRTSDGYRKKIGGYSDLLDLIDYCKKKKNKKTKHRLLQKI